MEYNKNRYREEIWAPDDRFYDKKRYEECVRAKSRVEERIVDEEYLKVAKMHLDPRKDIDDKEDKEIREERKIGMGKTFEDWKKGKDEERMRCLKRLENKNRKEETQRNKIEEERKLKEQKAQETFEQWKIKKAKERAETSQQLEIENLNERQKKEKTEQDRKQQFQLKFQEMLQHYKSRRIQEKHKKLDQSLKKHQRFLQKPEYRSKATSSISRSHTNQPKTSSQIIQKSIHRCPSPLLLAYSPNTSKSIELSHAVEQRLSNLDVNTETERRL